VVQYSHKLGAHYYIIIETEEPMKLRVKRYNLIYARKMDVIRLHKFSETVGSNK
jgi:hypothetical protein